MKFWSDSWTNGAAIPVRFAAGKRAGDEPGDVGFSDNVSPHFAWSDLPAGTQSLALICHDFDVPSRGDDVNQPGREIPADLPRVDFFHWLLVDIPPAAGGIAEAVFSSGFTPRGKAGPAVTSAGFEAARHGINDFTGWFAADAAMAGNYFGYDGPFPPWNDSLVHHYVFTLYALGVTRAPIDGNFSGADLRQAIHAHVLAEATHSGTYTLNARLLP